MTRPLFEDILLMAVFVVVVVVVVAVAVLCPKTKDDCDSIICQIMFLKRLSFGTKVLKV